MIERLVLSNFRSYESLDLDISGAKTIVITGRNGAGKTNILEAVSMFSGAGPMRKASLFQLGRIGGNPAVWTCFAKLADASIGVSAEYFDDSESGSRRIAIDGEDAQISELCRIARFAWATPAMDRLFDLGGGERRRFLDALASNFHPSYAAQISSYNSLLKSRARVLKSREPDSAWLDAIEAETAKLGVSIAALRLEFEEKLNLVLASSNGDFPAIKVSISGIVEDALRGGKAVAAEEFFRGELASNREAFKIQSAPAAPGVHRSDFSAFNLSKSIDCAQTSTGEQKIALISIILAYAKAIHLYFSKWPVLIIDEAAAHLDLGRREALFRALEEIPTQVWLSGTNEADFEFFRNKSAKFISLK